MVKKDIKENLSASLVLPKIMAKCLGFNSILDLLEVLKQKAGYEYSFTKDESNFMEVIQEYFQNITIQEPFNVLSASSLKQYDLNIKEHIDTMNQKRDITLKVYQYLALLVTEIYLDTYFQFKKNQDIDGFMLFLNNALQKIEKYADIAEYNKEDLEKLCFWMATGSGKTIVMHINFFQYLYYAKKYNQQINNVILITPNEDLSAQHERELRKSNIQAMLTSKQNYSAKTNIMKIIDINKLAEKSQIKRISYKAFGDNNLILVDEGHRGGSGETWMDYRNKIAKEGFTFEYSATFQDVKKDNDLASDYKKTILFDYSYKYYHKEGYGKDYFISNVNLEEGEENHKKWMMLGNLLSFYEQKKLFLKTRNESETIHLIENPLWILVGSKVVESKQDKLDSEIQSDILQFVNFLHEIKVKKTSILKEIEDILKNKTSLKTNNGEPFFQGKYPYLRKLLDIKFKGNYESLFKDILKEVFYSDLNDSKLILDDIKDSDGEIGLRYLDSNKYFGLIYVGVGNDKKIVESAKERKILTGEQTIKSSLFESLKQQWDKPLNILIGAKKFIEGWDNYRVSSMLLMNFAKSKGVSAIQLFGRGVRLHGYKDSMKRSSVSKPPINDKELKENLPILETLNVFGIKANYMDSFREELSQDIEFYIEREILIKKDPHNLLNSDLKCIIKDNDLDESFKNNSITELDPKKAIISINTDVHLSTISTEKVSGLKLSNKIAKPTIINEKFFGLVDWDDIITEIRRFKRLKDYRNISLIEVQQLKELMLSDDFQVSIAGDKKLFEEIKDHNRLKQDLERIYLEVIKKFLTKSYSINFKKHYDQNIKLVTIDSARDIPNSYKIKIYLDEKGKTKSNEADMQKLMKILTKSGSEIIDIKELEKEIESALISKDKIYVEFDQHLYFPLLLASSNGTYTLNPAGLNEGEVNFIKNLKQFIGNIGLKDKKIILLRNHEKTGFGYYLDTENYFPDFIMWVLNKDIQKIVFIDPKGLAIQPDFEKINFHKRIKEIESSVKKEYPKDKVEIFSFLVTSTKKSQTVQEIQESHEDLGIYFTDDPKYLDKIFKKIGSIS